MRVHIALSLPVRVSRVHHEEQLLALLPAATAAGAASLATAAPAGITAATAAASFAVAVAAPGTTAAAAAIAGSGGGGCAVFRRVGAQITALGIQRCQGARERHQVAADVLRRRQRCAREVSYSRLLLQGRAWKVSVGFGGIGVLGRRQRRAREVPHRRLLLRAECNKLPSAFRSGEPAEAVTLCGRQCTPGSHWLKLAASRC